MQSRSLAAVAATAALAALAGSAAASPADTTPAATVVMTKAGPAVRGSKTWRAGLARIAVESRVEDEETTLMHFRAGYSYSRFLTDAAKAHGHTSAARAAIRRVLANTVFDGGVDLFTGESASFAVRVRPGTYYLGEMAQRPQFTAIHVAGNAAMTRAAAAPRVTVTDAGFRISARTLPAHGTVAIVNAGGRAHRLNLIPVKAGTTRTQLGAYLRNTRAAHNAPPPPFALDGPQLGTAALSPHARMLFTFSLPPGTYAVIDFSQDMATGRPEALEGMYGVTTLR